MEQSENLQVVIVKSKRPEKNAINGLEGIVLGSSEENGELIDYAVYILEKKRVHGIYPDELFFTGKSIKYEDFYDGTSMSVKVDKEGSGEVVGYNEPE